MNVTPNIKRYTDIFRVDYPTAEKFTRTQLTKCFWSADEILVEKDVHSILVDCTPAERHGIFTVLKLFSLYEMKAGADYWTGRFMRSFPRHEIAAMGSAFGMIELCVHKPFYNKINELLNATDDSFYTDYVNNPVLHSRMQCIDSIIDHEDDLVSLAGFSLVEGVILYSSFAFLKHFQSCGKNKLTNIVRGINFSARDENLHSLGGAFVFNQLVKESLVYLPDSRVEESIIGITGSIYKHEEKIVDMIFEQGEIQGITPDDMKIFIKSRINICLNNLGLESLYFIEDNTIADWFYAGINNYQFNDFFTGQGREYTRDWNEEKFSWVI